MWRRRTVCILAVVLFFNILSAYASEYREATVVEIHRLPNPENDSVPSNGTATVNSLETYAITIQVDDTYYAVVYHQKWKWSFNPSEMNAGDKIAVRIDGDNLFVKRPRGKEVKTTIVSTKRKGW